MSSIDTFFFYEICDSRLVTFVFGAILGPRRAPEVSAWRTALRSQVVWWTPRAAYG